MRLLLGSLFSLMIAAAIGLGLTVDELREWAPFHPLEIYWARKNRLPLAEARRWAREGVPIRDAIKAREVRLSFAQLRHWQDAAFNPLRSRMVINPRWQDTSPSF